MPIFFVVVLCTFIYIQGINDDKPSSDDIRQSNHIDACTKDEKVREWSSWKGRYIWVEPDCSDVNRDSNKPMIHSYPKPIM